MLQSVKITLRRSLFARNIMPNPFTFHSLPRPLPSLSRSAVFAALFLAAPAFAVVDTPVREAMEAVNAKQAQKAFDLLLPLESSRAGDPDFDLALGIAANESGQFAHAIFALERVVALQPDNGRARAELARAMFAVGDTANARKLLQETKAQGVPDAVDRTIDEFLQAIDKLDEQGKPSARIHVEAALGQDSNVNSGPSVSTFAVPALGPGLVTLLPAGMKTSSSYLNLAAGVTGRIPLAPRWSFIGNAGISLREHTNNAANAFDIRQFDASGGASYREERNEFSGVLNVGQTNIGGSTLRRITGLTSEWTYRADGNQQWGSYLQLANLSYPSQPVRDARRTVLGTSFATQTAGGLVWYAGGYAGRESQKDAAFPQFGHRLMGLRGGLQMPIAPQWSLFAALGYENRRYNGPDLLFLTTRKDTQLDLSIGAAWRITDKWRITPQLSFNNSDSNIVINDSSKQVFSVTARYEF
jgi:outer membrane protein